MRHVRPKAGVAAIESAMVSRVPAAPARAAGGAPANAMQGNGIRKLRAIDDVPRYGSNEGAPDGWSPTS